MEEQYGYTVKKIGNDKTICLNKSKLVSTVEGLNRLGTYVLDGKLYHDGVLLLVPDENNEAAENPALESTGTFGEINLDTQGKQCINITIENYNRLLYGEKLQGYKPYNRFDVYNLVANPDTAAIVEYTEVETGYKFGNVVWPEKEHVIYNNVVGLSMPNNYSFDFDNNLHMTDCPMLDIRYFNPIITSGDSIKLECRVTDQHDSVLNYDTIGPRYDKEGNLIEEGIYKLIIKTEDGDTVTKYVYAGTIFIDVPAINIATSGIDRETWFSVQAIDSRGVASAEHFLNVYVRAEAYVANYWHPTDADLQEYGVTIDGDVNDVLSAYNNKQALSNLFQHAKDIGKNGIVLPTHDYYVDYHKNVGSASNAPVQPPKFNSYGYDISVVGGQSMVRYNHTTEEKARVRPTPQDPTNIFKFYHFSDIHGCVDSVNKVRQLLEFDEDAKFAFLTGDFCYPGGGAYDDSTHEFTNGNHKIVADALKSLSTDVDDRLLVLPGNHETIDGFGGQKYDSRYILGYTTECTRFIHTLLGDNVNWGDTSETPVEAYWYKDYPISSSSILRIISIDSYAYRNTDAERWMSVYSQNQIDWFIARVKELGEDDYLLIAMHEPPVTIQPSPDETAVGVRGNYDWCSNRLRSWAGSKYHGDMLPTIVDAYLRKTTLTKTFQNVENSTSIYTADIDINETFIGEPCTFLGYLCGHVHADIFHYHPRFPNQLIMCIDCGLSDMGLVGNLSDIRTREDGVLINEVTLDFQSKRIDIHRIGLNTTTSYKVTKGTASSCLWDNVDIHNNNHVYPSVVRDSITFPFPNTPDDVVTPVIYLQSNRSINLGSQTYYYVELSNNKIVSAPIPIDIEDVINDTYKIYRYPKDTGRSKIEVLANTTDVNGETPIIYVGDENWETLTTDDKKYLKDNYMYLRTYNRNVMSLYNSGSSLDLPETVANKKLYLVYNTAESNKYSLNLSQSVFRNNNIVFPNNFTVDLNGSNLISAWSNDVNSGQMVSFFYNTDVHIKNGKLIGPYGKDYVFLRAHVAIPKDVVGEHMHVCWNHYSKYCSYENLDISGAVGYDCGCERGGMQGNEAIQFEKNKYINNIGQIVSTDEELAITAKQSVSSDYIAYGRTAISRYVGLGKRHIIFASFYAGNGSFIKTIKSKVYELIPVPKDNSGNRAASVRVTAYGTPVNTNKDGGASNLIRSIEQEGNLAIGDPVLCIGFSVLNCTMHDTRTCAISNPNGRQILYKNIQFTRCATTKYLELDKSHGGRITPLLSDFEDNWGWAKYIGVQNWRHIKDSSQTSSAKLTICAIEHLDMRDNENIGLELRGMTIGGLIKNNKFKSVTMTKTRSCFHPMLDIRNNSMHSLNVSCKYSDSVVTKITEDTVYIEDNDTTEQTVYDVTKFDTDFEDTMEQVLALTDCTVKSMIQYGYFKLRHCKIDTLGVDYIN